MMMAAAVALVAAAVVTSAGAREEAREIRLVARGMAFYLDADPTVANPTITVQRGERVRFVLRNETPGIDHDLAIASMGVGLTPVVVGQSAAFDLQAPEPRTIGPVTDGGSFRARTAPPAGRRAAVALDMVGADATARMESGSRQEADSTYVVG